jgi:hypothetical protein
LATSNCEFMIRFYSSPSKENSNISSFKFSSGKLAVLVNGDGPVVVFGLNYVFHRHIFSGHNHLI